MFQKYSAKWNFHTEDSQILGATIQNLVTRSTRHLGCVHPWFKIIRFGKKRRKAKTVTIYKRVLENWCRVDRNTPPDVR
jgi:hypothetical protein